MMFTVTDLAHESQDRFLTLFDFEKALMPYFNVDLLDIKHGVYLVPGIWSRDMNIMYRNMFSTKWCQSKS